MKKRVLLPTDYPKNALNTIRYAKKLFEDIACEFYLLNACNASGYDSESMMVPEPREHFYKTTKRHSEDGILGLKLLKREEEEKEKRKKVIEVV